MTGWAQGISDNGGIAEYEIALRNERRQQQQQNDEAAAAAFLGGMLGVLGNRSYTPPRSYGTPSYSWSNGGSSRCTGAFNTNTPCSNQHYGGGLQTLSVPAPSYTPPAPPPAPHLPPPPPGYSDYNCVGPGSCGIK